MRAVVEPGVSRSVDQCLALDESRCFPSCSMIRVTVSAGTPKISAASGSSDFLRHIDVTFLGHAVQGVGDAGLDAAGIVMSQAQRLGYLVGRLEADAVHIFHQPVGRLLHDLQRLHRRRSCRSLRPGWSKRRATAGRALHP